MRSGEDWRTIGLVGLTTYQANRTLFADATIVTGGAMPPVSLATLRLARRKRIGH